MSKRPYYKVVVDPGHGGEPGAVNPALNLHEADINLHLAQLFAAHVFDGDYLFQVFLTRETDMDVSLKDRVKMANEKKADLFLSFHCNSAENPSANGYEVWTSIGHTKADEAATLILEGLELAMPDSVNRGARESNFYVLRNTTMPAVLIEFGFISNAEDAAQLQHPKFQQAIVQGVAEAVECWLESGDT